MAEKAQRDAMLDEWRDSIATGLRAFMAAERITQADLSRAMGMKQAALSRRLLGEVSFTAEELLFLADWMNRNVNEILASAKARTTNPCLSHSENLSSERWKWARAGHELAHKLYGIATGSAA